MATEKPTTSVTGKVHNARAIVWPVDTNGFTTLMKKEAVRSAGRIKGDEEKLKLFLLTLKTIGEHAKAKYADDVKVREARVAANETRAKEEAERRAKDDAIEAKRLRQVAAEATARAEALDGGK